MNFRVKIDNERCKGCELCIAFCPREILRMSEALNAKGMHFVLARNETDCVGCRRCSDICPEAAIEIIVESSSGE